MGKPYASATRYLRTWDPEMFTEIDRMKKAASPEEGEVLVLTLPLTRYADNPFLFYACVYHAGRSGIAVHVLPLGGDAH